MASLFSETVTTVTRDYIVPAVIDNVLDGNLLWNRFIQNRKPATEWGRMASGHQLKIPIKYQKSTTGGWYSFWDTFDTNQDVTRVLAEFNPRQMYWTVGAAGIQMGVNKTDAQVLDLLQTEMKSAFDDMNDTAGSGLYSDGTGTSNKQLDGLQATVNDGTDTATYAGLARGTYTTWVSDEDASSNSITRAEMAASFDAASHGGDHPTLGVTTETIWTTIEGLALGTINFNNPLPGLGKQYGALTRDGVKKGVGGELGMTALYFRGVPIVADEKCTSGRFYWLNERHLGLAMWPYPDFPGYVTKSNYNGYCWTGLKVPTNQDASVGQFLLYTNLVCDSCRAQSYMTNKS